MRVREILILAAELACRRDLADYLAGKNGEDASAFAREEEAMLRCYNLTENELALDYLPLRRTEKFVSDGCVAYTAFAEPPVEILSVRGETGRSLPFTAGEDGVLVRAGCVTVEYSVRPRVNQLFIVARNSGSIYRHIAAFHVFRPVSAISQVGAACFVPQLFGYFAQPLHAEAAASYKMNSHTHNSMIFYRFLLPLKRACENTAV